VRPETPRAAVAASGLLLGYRQRMVIAIIVVAFGAIVVGMAALQARARIQGDNDRADRLHRQRLLFSIGVLTLFAVVLLVVALIAH
jgi:Na+-driven multidrug efflux pump